MAQEEADGLRSLLRQKERDLPKAKAGSEAYARSAAADAETIASLEAHVDAIQEAHEAKVADLEAQVSAGKRKLAVAETHRRSMENAMVSPLDQRTHQINS